MDALLTTDDVAKRLGYSPVHVRRLARQGQINGVKFGRDWLFKPGGLLRQKSNGKNGRR